MSNNNDVKQQIKTELTPDVGVTKQTQILLRRKTAAQWE